MKTTSKRFSKVIAIILALVMIIGIIPVSAATPIGSSDNGDGTYSNPVIWADVPDMSMIRVGDAYYMSSTVMHMNPGVPIMRSYDLVNWEIISYCYYVMGDADNMKLQTGGNMYSNGTWASALAYKDGTFYCVVPSPTTNRTFIFQTEDPENQAWRRYELPSRYHDCGLLLDDDGRNWLVYGTNAIELNSTVTGLKDGARSRSIGLSSLHAPDPVTGVTPTSGLNEGIQIRKINGKYYLFAITWPNGKPRTEVCHISDSLFGPWESRVIAQEDVRVGTSGGGPAQGGIVDDVDGNWYGWVFRDSGSVGRIPWLVPITWDGQWPMFGQDKDGNPSYTGLFREGAKPIAGDFEIKSIVTSDEFYNNADKPLYYESNLEPLPAIPDTAANTLSVKSVDEADVKAAGAGELLTNGGFEDGTTGWTVNDTATLTVSTDEKHSGENSVYVTGRTTTGSGPKQFFTGKVSHGGKYEFSAWVKYNEGPDTKAFNVCIYNGTSWQGIDDIGQVTATKGEWAQIKGTYTLPDDASLESTAIFIETPYASSPDEDDLLNFYVDDVSWVEVSKPDPEPEPEPEPDPVANERIINGGFEDGLTGWFANNTYSSDGATLTVVQDDKVSGENALYVSDRKSTGSGPMQDMTGRMVAGGTYEVSVRIKYNNENGPARRQFYMTMRSNTPVSTPDNVMKNIRGGNITKGQWGTISGTYTVPADADNSAIAIFIETSWTQNPTADNDLMDFWVDDISIKVISEPEPEPELGDEIIVNGGLEAANEGEWGVHETSQDEADMGVPSVEITDAEAHTGDYSILVKDRMAVGTGPMQDVSGKLLPGAVYDVSAWIKYTNENSPATKQFTFSFKESNVTWHNVTSATITKGEWGQVKGTFSVSKDMDVDELFMFLETSPWTSNSSAKNNRDQHLFDFYADDISIKLAALPVVGDPLEDILGGQYTYNGSNLNNAWQWNHNPDNRYWSLTAREGWMRLTTGYKSTGLLNAPNTLSQRTFGPQSSAVIKMDVSKMNNGDVAGLSLFTAKYGAISVRMNDGKKTIVMTNNSSCRNHTDESGVVVAGTADLTSNIIYLKADADFADQTDKGYFYYSYDGINWTQLGNTLQMSYSTGNHFMGYRFNIFNYATVTTGGYVDIDFYRISDKLTGASKPTVLTAEMQGASNVPGTAVSMVDVPVSLDALPDGVYSEVAASFNIPTDLTVEDVVLGDGVVGDLDWNVNGKQLEVTVTGDDVALAAGKSVFVTLKLRVNELQATAKTLTVTPDYVIVRGDQNVAYNVDGVKADIRVLATEDGDAWAKKPGYANNLITHKFGADPFAMEYNGRLYIYMTTDTESYELAPDSSSNTYGNIRSITIISSDDMVNWTDHGKVEVGRSANGVTTWANNSWAPAAAHKTIDGKEKFFLYFCDSANGIGVLTADSPIGPWTDPIGKALVNRNTPNCGSSVVPWCFDPAVFVDEDGTGYLYFGGGIDGLNANNPKSARCVQLGDDMTSIVGTPVEIDAPRLFEDSGMHKHNGVYYYSYCSNFSGQNGEGYPATGTIAYMVSKSPLGPFTYAGEVLPGPSGLLYGDGGNNHHAIFEYEGRTFIVYHNRQVNAASRQERGLSGAGDYRSPAITELFYDSTNRLVKSRMEMEGVKQIREFNPYVEVQGETFAWQHGINTAGVYEGAEPQTVQPTNHKIININNSDWIGVSQVAFGNNGASKFSAKVLGLAGGKIEIVLDSLDGTKVAEVNVPAGDGATWTTVETAISGVKGTHDLFFRYVGEGDDNLFDIDYWQFTEASGDTASFDLIAETFDYWQDITKVVIDMGQEISGEIDKDAFSVSAKNYTTSLKETDAKFNYDGPRPVTAAYVSDADGNKVESGTYVTLELTYGVTQTDDPADTNRYTVDGAATGHYDDGARSFFTYDMNYSIVQNEAVAGIIKSEFIQDEIKDEILDKFELVDGYKGTNGSYVNYAFYKPDNADDGNKHPLMIWFHGMGEGGNPSGLDDGSTIDNGIQLYANRALAFADTEFQDTMDGAYFLAPQCPATWGIGSVGAENFLYAQTVKELIDELVAENNIDAKRIYVGGLSMGGKMTLDMVVRYPEMFAGVIGSACAASLNAEQAEAVKDIPFWFVTAEKDFCRSFVMTSYNNLIAAGAKDVKLTEYPEVTEGEVTGPFVWDGIRYSGHDGGWIPVYNNDPSYEDEAGNEVKIFDWLAAQNNYNPTYGVISVNGGDPSIAAEVAVNGDVTVVVNTETNVTKLGLINEIGKGISKKASYVDVDGARTWTLVFSLGTKGERTIDIYKSVNGGALEATDMSVNLAVGVKSANPAESAELIEVSAPIGAAVNQNFTVIVKTGLGASKLGFYNEKGAALGKKQTTAYDIDGVRTWITTLSVGSKGNRTIVVKSFDADGNALDKTLSFDIKIGKTEYSLINENPETFCNPINIGYRYQTLDNKNNTWRMGADSTPIFFKDKYWLFSTCNSGYWSSTDLVNWEYHYSTMSQINLYAPTAVVIGDYLYLTHSQGGNVYRTTDPATDEWELVRQRDRNTNWQDPYFFYDEDTERLFVVHGCAGNQPIRIAELDPETFNLLEGQSLNTPLDHPQTIAPPRRPEFGYENPGDLNDNLNMSTQIYLEGAGMMKHNGKYYVYYAGPGTEYASYCDGVYVADDPLGPYTWEDNSPFAYKVTGFTTGAAHGHDVVEQTTGNLWKMGTVCITNYHMFERRVSLYPIWFDENDELMADLSISDYPYYTPTNEKFSLETPGPDWNLLSYGAKVTASSTLDKTVVPYLASQTFTISEDKAFDEKIRTWWSAETDNIGEWIMGDMGEIKTVNALQLNFADESTDKLTANQLRDNTYVYRYILEYSLDGVNWVKLVDKSDATAEPFTAGNLGHDYFELNEATQMRYVRVTNMGPMPAGGKFAISDIRLFGQGNQEAPGKVEDFTLSRVEGLDERTVKVDWEAVEGAEGYIIRFGTDPNKLNIHHQVIGGTTETINSLARDYNYYFRIDTYNDSGRTEGTKIIKIEGALGLDGIETE